MSETLRAVLRRFRCSQPVKASAYEIALRAYKATNGPTDDLRRVYAAYVSNRDRRSAA